MHYAVDINFLSYYCSLEYLFSNIVYCVHMTGWLEGITRNIPQKSNTFVCPLCIEALQ